MAEFGLFIGWGSPRPGKEIAAVKVFEEGAAYWNALQTAGEIEGFEQVILGYHGGDLGGFVLLRGDPEKLGRLSMSPEFQRLSMRAAACLENLGVVTAILDAAVTSVMGQWQEVVADLI